MSTSVKYFRSTQSILPVLSGTAGALQTVMRAVLVTGAAAANVQTLTVAGGVATATYAADPGYIVDNIVAFSGSTPAGLNGAQRVLSRPTANSLTFATEVADGSASGTITSAMASAGWEESFSSGTTSVFKPLAVEALGMSLRVNDADGRNARVLGYETMSDVNTGTGPVPTVAQMSGGLYMVKSFSADAVVRPWMAVADGRGVHVMIAGGSSGRYICQYFGDLESQWSADAWAWLITGCQSDQAGLVGVTDACNAWSNGTFGAFVARTVLGPEGAVSVKRVGAGHNGATRPVYSGNAGYAFGQSPNPAGYGLLLSPVEVWDAGLRGRIPGLYHVRSTITLTAPAVIDGSHDLFGRRLLLVPAGWHQGASIGTGVVAIDLTGPWPRDGGA